MRTQRLSNEAKQSMVGDETPLFLATLGADGQPNCVPVTSLCPYHDETLDGSADHLVFAEIMLSKTRENLLGNDKVGVAVFNANRTSWSLKGVFQGFETTGPRIDHVNATPMLRYNAYTGARTAALIRVTSGSAKQQRSGGRVLCDSLRVRTAAPFLRASTAGGACMPRPVAEKFGRLAAVRALAFRDADGFPRAFPLLACVPAGPNRLLASDPQWDAYAGALAVGSAVAVAVIAMEPVAYQVKGVYRGRRAGVHLIDLRACYSASPPLPGGRLDRRPA